MSVSKARTSEVCSKERLIIATFIADKHTTSNADGKRRRYLSLDRALKGITNWMVWDGHAGAMITLHHDLTGLELGYIKMIASGKLTTDYIWEK